jgi:RNA polymerase sigma factor (sigma-70 family)
VLSKEEEVELARRVAAGDRWARKLLIEHNLRLVIFVLKPYARTPGIRVADLAHEGVLGLCVAADRFDAGRGVRFASYAQNWIRAYVAMAVTRHRLPFGGSVDRMKLANLSLVPNTVTEDGVELSRFEIIEDGGPSPLEAAEALERRGEVVWASNISAHSALELDIVARRLLSDAPLSLAEIGKDHGVSRERVRQVEKRLKERIERVIVDGRQVGERR